MILSFATKRGANGPDGVKWIIARRHKSMTSEKKTQDQRKRFQEIMEALYLLFVALVTIEY